MNEQDKREAKDIKLIERVINQEQPCDLKTKSLWLLAYYKNAKAALTTAREEQREQDANICDEERAKWKKLHTGHMGAEAARNCAITIRRNR